MSPETPNGGARSLPPGRGAATQRHRTPIGSIVLLVISAMIFSTGALFVRSLDDTAQWTTVFWRSAFASVSLIALLVWRAKGRAWRSIVSMGWPGVLVALAFSASSICMVLALSRASAAVVLVIFALAPLVAAVLGWLMIGERVAWYTWAAIVVTVAGVAYMVSGSRGSATALGVLFAFVIPTAFGFGAVVIRKHPEVEMIPAMLLAMVISAAVALCFGSPLDVGGRDLGVLALFGCSQLGLGLGLFIVGAANVPASEVALLAMLEPIFGPIWVWIFFAEYPGVSGLIGGAVVFAALAVHTVYAAPGSLERPTVVSRLQGESARSR